MRTKQEIIQRIVDRETADIFGTEVTNYLAMLDFDDAHTFLTEDATKEQWPTPKTLAQVDLEAKKYMSFWEEKIRHERGISVVRAKMQFIAWKWLLGHSDSDTFPGSFNSHNDGGHYQKDAYDYIKNQMDTGEWDKLTVW